jgi:hypothetical protein
MKELKDKTLQIKNIIKTIDEYYRFVNHADQLLTTGYKDINVLITNMDMIRFDNGTIDIMHLRYVKNFCNE